jgi:enoyl-CoA hydratase
MTIGRFPDEMGLETVNYSRSDGVAWIALNRPDSANAVTVKLCEDLLTALQAAERDRGIGCVVLIGEGRHFCAGADLVALKAYQAADAETRREPFNLRALFAVTLNIRQTRLPVIAAVNGAATGGGLDLACATDIRIASSLARFGETYVRVGQAPSNGGTHFLPLLVGTARACELAFTGQIIDAETAANIGLVNRVVDHDQLVVEAQRLAAQIAQGPREALDVIKKAIYRGPRQTLEETLAEMYDTVGWLQQTDDAVEGVNAFFEKRAPNFRRD